MSTEPFAAYAATLLPITTVAEATAIAAADDADEASTAAVRDGWKAAQ